MAQHTVTLDIWLSEADEAEVQAQIAEMNRHLESIGATHALVYPWTIEAIFKSYIATNLYADRSRRKKYDDAAAAVAAAAEPLAAVETLPDWLRALVA